MSLPTPYELIVLALASYRLTHFIVFDRLGRILRRPFADEEERPTGSGWRRTIGEGITCYWCAGIWSSILLYLGFQLFPAGAKPLISVLAIAGIQATLESWVRLNLSRMP